MFNRRSLLLAGLAALLGPATLTAADAPPGPAYQIVLRSRHAEVTPSRTKDAQTGGGSIIVEEPEPNTVIVTMGGSAVVGSDFHGSAAEIAFDLQQDLDIFPTRKGVRPPRAKSASQRFKLPVSGCTATARVPSGERTKVLLP